MSAVIFEKMNRRSTWRVGLIVVSLLDHGLTGLGLKRGLEEANPFIQRKFEALGFPFTMALDLFHLTEVVLFAPDSVVAMLTVLDSITVLNNAWLLLTKEP